MCTYILTYMHTYNHAYKHTGTCIDTYVYIYMYQCIYIYIYIYIYTYIHTCIRIQLCNLLTDYIFPLVVSSCVATLEEKLEDASTEWNYLGIQLGLKKYDLPQENSTAPKKSFMEMLSFSLNNPPEFPYQRRILFEAVKSIDRALALEIEKDYNNDKQCECKL